MFGKLNHVAIYVKSREEAIRFYTEILGGRLLYTVDNESDGLLIAMVEMDGYSMELLQPPAGQENIIPAALATANHFAVEVDDIDAATAFLAEKGYPMEKPGIYDMCRTSVKGRNLRVAFIHGPNGERIELFWQNMKY